jgi:hypothetical protein
MEDQADAIRNGLEQQHCDCSRVEKERITYCTAQMSFIIYDRSPLILLANWMSLGMMVTRFA